jgi:dinuclear metal center YbgI/SA1388 family protein
MKGKLARIVALLDRELKTASFDDGSNNGLQVENSGRVGRVCCGVDASVAFIEAAARRGAGLLICHHGISWGDSLKRITERNYRIVSLLMEHDLALYASHLPLDAHPRLGNNAQICRALGLRRVEPFGVYRGQKIGFCGELRTAMTFGRFKTLVERTVNPDIGVLEFGKAKVRSVGVVSGGAAEEIAEAAEKGLDVYLTGEPSLNGHNLGQDLNMNVIFAGHYATERFGVQALGRWVAARFGVPWEFVDLGVPF